MVTRVLITLHILHAVLHAAQPAERPWPRRPGRPAADATPTVQPRPPVGGDGPHRPGTVTEVISASAPTGGTRRGGRGASRRRGRRGGANWRRHGDTETHQLIIGQLNIQSYKPKLPDLRQDIDGVYGFDVLALCESWLTPNVPDRLIGVSGYKLYRGDRPTGLSLPKGKGGVAVLVRDRLSSELLPTPTTGIADSNLEIVWVLVHASKHRPVLVASAYRVPTNTASQLATDLEDLEYQIQLMLANFPRATVMICGDFNCCLLKTRRNNSSNPLLSMFGTYGLHAVNTTKATYRPANSLLDIIATNRPDLVQRAGVTRCHYGGPHDFTRVLLTHKSREATAPALKVHRRAISKVDQAAFNQQLSEADWSPVFSSVTTESKWTSFRQIFTSQLNTVAPPKLVRQREFTAPPVSAETQRLLQRRREALAGTDRAQYKEVNKLCRAACRRDHREQYEREIGRGDRGGLWRVLRPVLGRKQRQCEIPRITPDALNDYYVTVGPTTAASVPPPTVPVPTRLARVSTCTFTVHPIDIYVLYSTLASMKPSNSTGSDGISVAMMQKFFAGVGFALLDIVNSSLTSGTVPREWKHALVTPIPKGKVSVEPSDTRPISILPTAMKIVERVVQKQLTGYLEEHSLLSDAQHGYRKFHSTETALHAITDRALHAMDKGDISILVLLDLSKCFDVVPHEKLLEKLSLYGITTDWFRNYLADHTQQVQVRCADGTTMTSKTKENTIGVYQGGALSCIMYMLYANDLSLFVAEDVSIVQYADDTQLMVTGRKADVVRLIARMEDALDTVYQWFCHNGMKLNAKKTQMIVLGTPTMLRDLQPIKIQFCGTIIPESKVVKNLGVSIDRHLSFDLHIDHMAHKCTGILIALNHARHTLPRSVMKGVVEALVLSIVRYCMSVYGSCTETQVHRVQKIVNFCARVVTGRRRYDHVSDAISQLGWLTAKQLVAYHTVCAVERIIVSGIPQSLHHTIGPRARQQHSHDTRRADLFTLPSIRIEAGRRRLNYRGVSLLNDTRVEPGTVSFRAEVKQLARAL